MLSEIQFFYLHYLHTIWDATSSCHSVASPIWVGGNVQAASEQVAWPTPQGHSLMRSTSACYLLTYLLT